MYGVQTYEVIGQRNERSGIASGPRLVFLGVCLHLEEAGEQLVHLRVGIAERTRLEVATSNDRFHLTACKLQQRA